MKSHNDYAPHSRMVSRRLSQLCIPTRLSKVFTANVNLDFNKNTGCDKNAVIHQRSTEGEIFLSIHHVLVNAIKSDMIFKRLCTVLICIHDPILLS